MSIPVVQHFIVHVDVEAVASDFSAALDLSDDVRLALGRMDLGRCTTSVEALDHRSRDESGPVSSARRAGRLVGVGRAAAVEDVRYRGDFLG